jgi:hypothetical protein
MPEKTNKSSKLMDMILDRCECIRDQESYRFTAEEFEKFVGIIVDQCATEIVVEQHKMFWKNKPDFGEIAVEAADKIKRRLGV